MVARTATVGVKLLDDVTGPSARVSKALFDTERAAKAVSKAMAAGVSPRMASDLSRLGLSADHIKRVTNSFKDYTSAAKLAGTAGNWTKADLAKIKQWEVGTIAALRRVQREEEKAAAKAKSHGAGRGHGIGSAISGHYNVGHIVAGAVGAHAAKSGVEKIAHTYAEFDDLRRYQQGILHLSDKQQKPFLDQAFRMGATTKFNDLQVLEAQLDLAQRGVKADYIIPFVEKASQYAMAMNTTLPEAAKTLEGFIFGTGKHIDSANEAMATMQRAVDFSTKLAKIGGLDNEDIKQFYKYGGMPGSAAGLSDNTIGAMAALMRRANIRGDEAGVAVRAIAGKLVSPTQKGVMALNAMGIDYNKYLKTPEMMSVGGFEGAFKTKFGKALSPKAKAELSKVLGDPEKTGNMQEFISGVLDSVQGEFQKTKKGGLKAVDRVKIAKLAEQFFKLSVENVDSEGLLRAIAENNPTLAQLNALFTDKQGARARAALKDPVLLADYQKQLKDAPDGFAKQIADIRMGGFAGALAKAEGAILNFQTAVGRANDSLLTGVTTNFASFVQHVSELDGSVLRLGSYFVMAGAAALALAGTFGTARLITAAGAMAGIPGATGALGLLSKFPRLGKMLGFVGKGSGWLTALWAAYEYGPALVKGAPGADNAGAVARGEARDRQGAVSGNNDIERLNRRQSFISELRGKPGTPEEKRRQLVEWDAANPKGGSVAAAPAAKGAQLPNIDAKGAGVQAGQEFSQGIGDGINAAAAVAKANEIRAAMEAVFASGITVAVKPQVQGLGDAIRGVQADSGVR